MFFEALLSLLISAAGLITVGLFVYVIVVNIITLLNIAPAREVRYGLSTILTIALLLFIGSAILNVSFLVFLGCCGGVIMARRRLLSVGDKGELTAPQIVIVTLGYLIAGGLLGVLAFWAFCLSFAYLISSFFIIF